MTKSNIIFKTVGVSKSYRQGDARIKVLDNVDFTLHKGEIVAVVGPSGCGKSTLLHAMGLLDSIDSGSITIDNIDYSNASNDAKTKCRLRKLGFVYQSYNLLTEFTAIENVAMPLRLQGMSKSDAEMHASILLGSLGLSHRTQHFPAHLSGGEQQRVAIARSLIHHPQIIFADEPTGNLDEENAKGVIELLFNNVRERGTSLVIVTHNNEISRKADRVVTIKNGVIHEKI